MPLAWGETRKETEEERNMNRALWLSEGKANALAVYRRLQAAEASGGRCSRSPQRRPRSRSPSPERMPLSEPTKQAAGISTVRDFLNVSVAGPLAPCAEPIQRALAERTHLEHAELFLSRQRRPIR